MRGVLVLGGQGQIGRALQGLALPEEWRVAFLGREEADITSLPALRAAVQKHKPQLIINAAGMTDVEACEQNPDAAFAANFQAIALLAAQCSARDVPLIHLSSSMVFDGWQNSPYSPDDPMNPLNVYGQSKLMGEEVLRHELPWHVILRLSWVFSSFGNNFLVRALRILDEQDNVIASDDHLDAPLSAMAVAQAIVVIGKALLGGKGNGFGTFHLCGSEPCTPYKFMQAVADVYAPLAGRQPAIKPVVDAPFISITAERPRYAVLDCSKTRSVYSIEQPSWREELGGVVRTVVGRIGLPLS